MHRTQRVALAATFASLLPAMAFAADVTPEQARTVEAQLRGWFASVLGPKLPVASSPIQVTPAGDHYLLTAPAPGAAPVQGSPKMTANAKPADGGRWTLNDIHIQTPATFTVNRLAAAAADGKAVATVPTTVTLDYATQEGGGTWDPNFKTASVINSVSTGTRMVIESAGMQQVTTVERSNAAFTLRPAGDDRVDADVDVTMTGWALATKGAAAASDQALVQLAARQLKVQIGLAGVSRERGAQLIPALAQLGPPPGATPDAVPNATPNATPGTKAPPRPEAVRALMQVMQGLASEATVTEVLDGFSVSGAAANFVANQLRFGLDVKADGGFAGGGMDVGLDGLALPGMGLDAFADLLPHKIALRPVVSHVPTQEVLQLLQTAIETPDSRPSPEQVSALFSHGGLKAGLESFALDLGGASFAGTASVDLPTPNAFSGTAQVTAMNLDGLLAKVQANPALAQAVPAIVFAKGVGRAEGDKMVWDVQFGPGKLLVNGVDLTRMAGK